jgi:hypothetical protein
MQSLPSTAAQIIVTIIPIVGIVMGCVIIFFFMLYNHRQRIIMIEKGIERRAFDIDTYSLFTGIMLLGVGLCLTLFFVIKEGASYSVLGGIIPLSSGLSLISFFIIRIKTNKRKND